MASALRPLRLCAKQVCPSIDQFTGCFNELKDELLKVQEMFATPSMASMIWKAASWFSP
jgi:hypothetical protein